MASTAFGPPMTYTGDKQPNVVGYPSKTPGSDVEDGSQPIGLLDQKHPEYDARYEAWLDLSLMYEGGSMLKAHCERLLKKRPREDEEVYAARMDRFTYQNILGTGLGWYGAAMFDTVPEIFFNGASGSDDWTKFIENCDGLGTSYVDFFKKAFQTLLTYGAGWILTDTKALEDGEEAPQTMEQEISRGLLEPHLCLYTPLNVINWQTDSLGNVKWAVIRTESEAQAFLGKAEIVVTWYYFDCHGYRVYEDRRSPDEQVKVATDDSGRMAKLLRQGKHSLAYLNKIPLRRISLSEGLWLANRAYLLLIDHLNQDNTYAWSLFMSNLAMPIIIGDTDPTSSLTYSEVGYLHFPTGTKYEWSEPEGKSFEVSSKRVESLREECFRSLNLQAQGRSMKATPAMQSGRSKILEMSPAKQVLAGMGDDLRKHMQDVLCDVRDSKRQKNVKPDVRGFNFQEDMSTEEVFAVTSLLNLKIPSNTFEKYILKKVARSWMPDANREEITKIYKEIDAAPTREERDEQEMRKRIDLAKEGMRMKLDGASGGQGLPPGRGGSGPSATTGAGEGKGETK